MPPARPSSLVNRSDKPSFTWGQEFSTPGHRSPSALTPHLSSCITWTRISQENLIDNVRSMKLAIAATIRRWDSNTDNWVRYHSAIGFERIYIFCDEPFR